MTILWLFYSVPTKIYSMRIRLAELYDKEGRYDEAINLCKEVLVFDPDYVAAHHILGMAYCGQGRMDEGIVRPRCCRSRIGRPW